MKQFTVKQFAETQGIKHSKANALVVYLREKGFVKEVGKMEKIGQKGKTASIYEFPDDITLKF